MTGLVQDRVSLDELTVCDIPWAMVSRLAKKSEQSMTLETASGDRVELLKDESDSRFSLVAFSEESVPLAESKSTPSAADYIKRMRISDCVTERILRYSTNLLTIALNLCSSIIALL